MFSVNWKEDSSAEILGRVTARNGSGVFTGQPGEGRFIQQADVVSITCTHYDMTLDPDRENPTNIPTLAADVILDDPDDSGESWTSDAIGYNFAHHILPEYFPEGGNIYRIEYRFELVGGYVFHDYFEGPAAEVYNT